MEISDHAIVRYLERIGNIDAIKQKIINGMTFGRVVALEPKNPVSNTIANKYKPTKTLLGKATNAVYIIRDNTLVTVFKYDANLWVECGKVSGVDGIYAPIEHHQKIKEFAASLGGVV